MNANKISMAFFMLAVPTLVLTVMVKLHEEAQYCASLKSPIAQIDSCTGGRCLVTLKDGTWVRGVKSPTIGLPVGASCSK